MNNWRRRLTVVLCILFVLLIAIAADCYFVLIDAPLPYKSGLAEVRSLSNNPVRLLIKVHHGDSVAAVSKITLKRKGEEFHIDVRVGKLWFLNRTNSLDDFAITFTVPDDVNVITFASDRHVIWERAPKDESEAGVAATN